MGTPQSGWRAIAVVSVLAVGVGIGAAVSLAENQIVAAALSALITLALLGRAVVLLARSRVPKTEAPENPGPTIL